MKRKFSKVWSVFLAVLMVFQFSGITLAAGGLSTAPIADNITVVNNAGIADTVTVTGLTAGNIIKVYSSSTAQQLGSATVATGKTDATVSVSQLGTGAGSVYVSVTGTGMLESNKVEKDYIAEATTTAPLGTAITVTNNTTGKADTVALTGLKAKDVVKVYRDATATTVLGTATVAAAATTATVSITQLGTAAGSVYVTVTSYGSKESTRTKADYIAEAVSTAPLADTITIVNNAGIADTIKVTGLAATNIVKVYKDSTTTTVLGTATVPTGKTEVTVSIPQLATGSGTVYVTVTSSGKLQSARTAADYTAEATSTAPLGTTITVTNNTTGKADTVALTGLKAKDIVKVYRDATATTALGTATVAASATVATVSITQLGIGSGSVYVSVTNAGSKESVRTKADYIAESVSTAPIADNITIVNNAGIADTIKVTLATPTDIVRVYKDSTTTTPLGTAAVPAGKTEVTVSISQLATGSGTVYVTVTSSGKLESTRTAVAYLAEATTTAPADTTITVTNNTTGKADTVALTGLKAKDIVKVYRDATATTALGTATVAASATVATVSITQLGTGSGSVYVSVTNAGSKESTRTKADYIAEAVSTAPITDNITVTNNSGIADTIKVSLATPTDIVKVYKDSTSTTPLGTATVPAGKTEATVSIAQLSTGSGTVYVTVTSSGKLESARTAVDYTAESATTAPDPSKALVINNSGTDLIVVYGIKAGDTVKVYNVATGGTVLATAKAGGGGGGARALPTLPLHLIN